MSTQINLSSRLAEIASMIPDGAVLADVGTDHGHLPIWLLQNEKIKYAIASDLRRGPLDTAKAAVVANGLQDRIDCRLCNGLSGIVAGEVDTVVIAGMGGETMIHILAAAPWVQDKAISLFLQPMTMQPELRHWLWESGFSIVEERIVRESGILYTIFCVRWGEKTTATLAEEWAGKQFHGQNAPLRTEYLNQLIQRVERALTGLSRSKKQDKDEKKCYFETVHRQLTEMKEAWLQWQQ